MDDRDREDRAGRSMRRGAGPRSHASGGDALHAAREAALTLIERRLRTRADLETRLGRRGFASGVVRQVLDRLSEVGLVSDRDYAEAFLRDRLRFRPRSGRLLRLELRQRAVDPAAIEAAMEALAGELDELGLARSLLGCRGARLRRLPPADRERRASALLRRNGFAWEVIREALAVDNLEEEGLGADAPGGGGETVAGGARDARSTGENPAGTSGSGAPFGSGPGPRSV